MEESVSDVADSGTAENVMSERLNCPLCLDVYKQPRSLACLHTFCETCIDLEIQRNAKLWTRKSEIRCPVCKEYTVVPDTAQSWEEWTKALPFSQSFFPLADGNDTETETKRFCDACAIDLIHGPAILNRKRSS